MRPAVGDRLAGRYAIRAITAERPTGQLLRGFDEQIGVEVALRTIDEELLVDDDELRVFVQRAARARTLQHPNLIRLYDVLVDNRAVFLVMQWAPGERLSTRLGRPLAMSEARLIIRRAAAGIAHAHQHGVVLGNVRADTVILYPDGLKLTNVGIGPALPRARFLAAMAERGALDALAPEVRAGKDPDERSDLFALAALARTLIDTPAARISDEARAILDRALATDSKDRPRDPEGFVRELEAAIDRPEGERPSLNFVPTGSDTERVPKLDSITEPTLAPVHQRGELSFDHGSGEAVTNPQGRYGRIAADPVELKIEELVEAAICAEAGEGATGPLPRVEQLKLAPREVTDVGHRSPVRAADEPEPPASAARLPSPPRPRTATPVPAPTRIPTPVLPPPRIPTPPPSPVLAPPPPPLSSEPTAKLQAVKPSQTFEDDQEATRRVARIEIDPGPLPPGVRPPPPIAEQISLIPEAFVEPVRSGRPPVIAGLLFLGLTLGAFGVIVLWTLSTRQRAASQQIVITMPSMLPAPAVPSTTAPAPPTPAVASPAPPSAAKPATTTPVVVSTPPAVSPTPARTEPPPAQGSTPKITAVTAVAQPIVAAPPVAVPTPARSCALGMARLTTPHPFCIDLYEYPGGHTNPRTQVSFSDASQICAGRGLRLCSDSEWEQACRGPSGASYPYGQSFDAQRCNTGGKSTPGTVQPAGAMTRCRSASGAYDMSGNVAEWSSSGAQRGGSALGASQNARCSHVVHGGSGNGAPDVGFRCCGDAR